MLTQILHHSEAKAHGSYPHPEGQIPHNYKFYIFAFFLTLLLVSVIS